MIFFKSSFEPMSNPSGRNIHGLMVSLLKVHFEMIVSRHLKLPKGKSRSIICAKRIMFSESLRFLQFLTAFK